jgi:hypothetical protein
VNRPLPPELLHLGDQLEAAASRALNRRRARRQQALNAVASLVVAVPLVISIATNQISTGAAPLAPPTPTPTTTAAPGSTGATERADGATARSVRDDMLPRDLTRMREAPNSELLILSPSLRPALR